MGKKSRRDLRNRSEHRHGQVKSLSRLARASFHDCTHIISLPPSSRRPPVGYLDIIHARSQSSMFALGFLREIARDQPFKNMDQPWLNFDDRVRKFGLAAIERHYLWTWRLPLLALERAITLRQPGASLRSRHPVCLGTIHVPAPSSRHPAQHEPAR